MTCEEAHREILGRQWDWEEMTDDETEGLLARLEAAVHPHVPHFDWDNDGGWSSAACAMVVASCPAPRDFHNSLNFWRAFDHEALYLLYANLSARARVYTTVWNVFPKRHLELLQMSAEQKERLSADYNLTYGPCATVAAPTDVCRGYERVVRDAFATEDILWLPSEALAMPSPLKDFSHARDGTIWSTLFGII